MKTPDEIKKGLECYLVEVCNNGECDKCSRDIYTAAEVYANEPIRDALDLIKQLEAELYEAKSCIERIRTTIVDDMSRADELRQYVYAVARTIRDWENGDNDNA